LCSAQSAGRLPKNDAVPTSPGEALAVALQARQFWRLHRESGCIQTMLRVLRSDHLAALVATTKTEIWRMLFSWPARGKFLTVCRHCLATQRSDRKTLTRHKEFAIRKTNFGAVLGAANQSRPCNWQSGWIWEQQSAHNRNIR